MKKHFLTFIFSLLTLCSYAQTENPHLTFKGVPIDGTLNQFVQKMRLKGFTFMGTQDGITLLEGDFAGYKGCIVGVSTLDKKDLVNMIVVMFPELNTWSSLYGNYSTLKELLTEKYGRPSDVIEKFEGYSEPRDDNSRMHEVKMDRCKYISVFETSKGTIELQIAHGELLNCFIVLRYLDKINGNEIRQQALDDL
ncbi:MAG: hypothetical protein IKO20_09435 [Bacteroidaceae bacterium]|nr:hypothetical protein [Bacteroidaceae bacterium]